MSVHPDFATGHPPPGRRQFLALLPTVAALASLRDSDGDELKRRTFAYIRRCARDDGGYRPSPDATYAGSSDTAESDLAAVTYAATLSKTFDLNILHPSRSIEFVQRHQRRDGSFANFQGNFNPDDDLAVLYNTTQGAVALRALGSHPKSDPAPVMDRFFAGERLAKLPWYSLSFFPLFYAALNQPFPASQRQAIRQRFITHQADDGYVGDHVAATFHMTHFFRLIGEPVPRAEAIIERVLRDQKPDGGWNIKERAWDVHACFDAVFILRQLGGNSRRCRRAIEQAAGWVLRCRTPDGGFAHYPDEHSDMDAVYFQFGTLIQAERIPGVNFNRADGHVLSWGHCMQPGRTYWTKPLPGRTHSGRL